MSNGAANDEIDPRSLPVRFSRLKLIAQSPAHYHAAVTRTTDDETMAMRIGSGTHAMILGQPVERYSARRAGNDWLAYLADHPDTVILNDREWAEARSMASVILRHREACAILFDGTELEKTIAWQWLGRACSSRPDARGRTHIADLKTTRTSKPGLFAREAIRMHYHAQLAFYDEANHHERGERFSNAYLVAVEKTAPHPVTIFRLTDRALDLGRQCNRIWMEQLLACEANNDWPGYASGIVDLDVPDIEGPIELEINGQLTEVS